MSGQDATNFTAAACIDVTVRDILSSPALGGLIASAAYYLCVSFVALTITLIVFHKQLLALLLYIIDTIVGGVLTGPSLAPGIAKLLEQPPMQHAIAHAVGEVLKNNSTRHEISHVVAAVLDHDVSKAQIASVVREVLTTEEVSDTIGRVVGGCLKEDIVAHGIVGTIKNTSKNVLCEAADLGAPYMPAWARTRIRRLAGPREIN